jgi:hypothetical protein
MQKECGVKVERGINLIYKNEGISQGQLKWRLDMGEPEISTFRSEKDTQR